MMGLRVTVLATLIALTGSVAAAPASQVVDPFTNYPQITATSDKQYGPPTTESEAWPWKIGQWVVYKRVHGSGIALEQLRIVAQDSCGFWIEWWMHENGARKTWLYCVRSQPSADDTRPYESLLAVAERQNREVALFEDLRAGSTDRTRWGWLVASVMSPAPGRTDLTRENVPTPIGTFQGAAKVTTSEGTGEVTRWSHPAVPLGGIVKETTSDYERVLVGFGMTNSTSLIDETVFDMQLAQQSFRDINKTGPLWLSLRFGFASVGTPGDTSGALGFGTAVGFRVSSRLDAVANFTLVGDTPYAKDAALTEEMWLAGVGARWFPVGRTRNRNGTSRRSWLFAQGDVAYASLERRPMDGDSRIVGRGVAVGASVGLVGAQGRDWSCTLELHDDLAFLNSDEGLRNSFGLLASVQLYTQPTRVTLPW
jgi:hypothetical protein